MQPTDALDPLDAGYEDLLSLWRDLEAGLGILLMAPASVQDFVHKQHQYDQWMQALLLQDVDVALYLLFQMAGSSHAGYSAQHALVCAALCHVTAAELALPRAERDSLIAAAMTMNIAMTAVQDALAEQTGKPDPAQLDVIAQHAARGQHMLQQLGVRDALWLAIVGAHHSESLDPADGGRLAQVLRAVDRYAAMISPRKTRAGRTATDSGRTIIGTTPDEVGRAVVRAVGLCPPGTFVRLDNGETGVVLRRGPRPNHYLVAGLYENPATPFEQPRIHRTGAGVPRVQASLHPLAVPFELNHRTMIQLGLREAAREA